MMRCDEARRSRWQPTPCPVADIARCSVEQSARWLAGLDEPVTPLAALKTEREGQFDAGASLQSPIAPRAAASSFRMWSPA